ncbi:MAG TPA: WbqC family protein [Syntrophorhabdaceae bacterium]|nr:WbqC family protein [Syntrophorhabdaceae bacterium]
MRTDRVVTIHQPEFAPWLGFFNKIWQSDVFIVMDDVQFKKNHFENRNKIRTLDEQGWTWIKVPVLTKGRFGQKICQVEINSDGERRWRDVLLKTVRLSYQRSIYFDEVYGIIERCIEQGTAKLVDINVCFIVSILGYLGIQKEILMQSEMNTTTSRSQLLADLIESSGCNIYLSGQSGKVYLDLDLMKEKDIIVRYQNFKHPQYEQSHGAFMAGMSIIDLLFNYGRESVKFIEGFNHE